MVAQLVTGQPLQLLAVARRHQAVRRRQRHPELVIRWDEIGIGASVELFFGVAQQHTLADLVENGRHSVIAELPEHRRQRHGRKFVTPEAVGGEEIRRVICGREKRGLAFGDHRRQLVQVTHQHDLHPAERRSRLRPEA
jgi:hypothetical protein